MSSDLAEIHGRFLEDTAAGWVPITLGSVRFTPTRSAVSSSTDTWLATVTLAPVTAELTSAGSFSLLLLPSDDPGWRMAEPMTYRCEIRVPNKREEFRTLVLGLGPHDIDDLVRLP